MQPYIALNDVQPWHRGKVRSTYIFKPHLPYLAPVAEDRVSTHNVEHTSLIPGKGEVLTMLTIYWLTEVLPYLPNHLVFWGADIYKVVPKALRRRHPDLHYRTLVVQELTMLPVEFVLRRYLTGSLWKHYRASEDPYGLALPLGLTHMTRFDDWVFTPTDKSSTDDPLLRANVTQEYPTALELVMDATYEVERFLARCGIVLVDTKLEGGFSTEK